MCAIVGMMSLAGAFYAAYYIGKETGRHEAQEERCILDDDYFDGDD